MSGPNASHPSADGPRGGDVASSQMGSAATPHGISEAASDALGTGDLSAVEPAADRHSDDGAVTLADIAKRLDQVEASVRVGTNFQRAASTNIRSFGRQLAELVEGLPRRYALAARGDAPEWVASYVESLPYPCRFHNTEARALRAAREEGERLASLGYLSAAIEVVCIATPFRPVIDGRGVKR